MRMEMKPIVAMEDFSHLNPPSSKRSSEAAKKSWSKQTPAEKERRARFQSAAGKRNKGKVRTQFQ